MVEIIISQIKSQLTPSLKAASKVAILDTIMLRIHARAFFFFFNFERGVYSRGRLTDERLFKECFIRYWKMEYDYY